MFKIFKKLNKVEIISEPERRVDGFYFHVKVPCVVEPLTISTRDLLAKHVSQLSKEDKNIVINTFKLEVKYKLLYITDDEFLLLDLQTGKDDWLDLNYFSLKKLPENSLSTKDIIKITQRLEYQSINSNNNKFNNFLSYDSEDDDSRKVIKLKLVE